MPKVSKVHLESRRKQIMQAALVCTARKGFHQTTMRDICKEAKMSIGAVYNYYKSKEEILAAITKGGRQAKKLIFDRINACPSARESLRELFKYTFLAYKDISFRTYGSIDLEVYGEASRNEKIRQIMLEEYDALMKPMVRIIQRWQKEKEIRDDIDPHYFAHYMIAISVGIKIQLLVQPELTVEGFEDVVEKAFMETVWPTLNTEHT